jgi:CrcB protein
MTRRPLVKHTEAIVLIAIGGALGTMLRSLAGAAPAGALLTTLAVNATGSFALGLVIFDARADELVSKRLRYVFATGFLASFTTYSTFVADVATAPSQIAILYLLGSYGAGFGGVLLSRGVVETLSTAQVRPPAGDR